MDTITKALLSSRDRKVEEFCVKGKLEAYREILVSLFSMIESDKCRISARDDEDRSFYSFDREEKIGIIRISLIGKSCTEPLQIIWTILHEFGHHKLIKNEEENNMLKDLAREEYAWDQAEKMMLKYPALSAQVNSFTLFKEQCLDTYRKHFRQQFS